MFKTMKNTVNTRILSLKDKLGLGHNEFCYKADISTATLHSISNEAEIRPRTVRKIAEALGANSEWLLTGKGEMFLPAAAKEDSVVWKDETYKALKEEVAYYRELLKIMASNKGPLPGNFLKALDFAGAKVIPLRKTIAYSGAKVA